MNVQAITMNKSELNAVIVAYQNGQEDKLDTIFKAVYKYIAKSAYEHSCFSSATVDELISGGYMMMLRALQTYEPSRGYSFLTYFKDWLKKGMKREGCFADSSVYVHENYWKNLCVSTSEKINGDGDDDITLGDTIEGDCGMKADVYSDMDVLKDALNELSESERQVVTLVELKGYRLSEVAEMRGTTRQAVNGVHKTAMEKLRKYIKNI